MNRILRKVLKIGVIVVAIFIALLLVDFVLGWANKHFGKLYFDNEVYCTQNVCFKMGVKGDCPVVFKSEDGKTWNEVFPSGKIAHFNYLGTRFSSLETNGNNVWVTEIMPAPGETTGEIVDIFYSHDLGVTWNTIPEELSSLFPIIYFDKDGNGKLIVDYLNNTKYYYKTPKSTEWILDSNTHVKTDTIINGNITWETKKLFSDKEPKGLILDIYYKENQEDIWSQIPSELVKNQPKVFFEANGAGELVYEKDGNIVRYYKAFDSGVWEVKK